MNMYTPIRSQTDRPQTHLASARRHAVEGGADLLRVQCGRNDIGCDVTPGVDRERDDAVPEGGNQAQAKGCASGMASNRKLQSVCDKHGHGKNMLDGRGVGMASGNAGEMD